MLFLEEQLVGHMWGRCGGRYEVALLLALHVSIQQSPPHQFRDKSRDRNGQRGRDVLETGAVVVSPWEFAVIRYLQFQCSKNNGAADGVIV